MAQQPELENQSTEIPNQANESDIQNPDSNRFWYEPISRREALKRGTVLVGGTVAAVAGAKKIADTLVPPNQEPEPKPNSNPEQTASPEVLKSDMEFGFNTHVHAFPNGETDNMTLEAFKGDIDKLAEAKQEWVRFNLINPGVITQNADGSLEFSEGIGVFDQAINYAKEKGLKIAFVTNPPESLASLPINEYTENAAAFYTQLALKYGDKIDNWQIFNEADTHHFRNYQSQNDFDQAYLDELKQVVEASAEAIKAINPQSKITMNASLWAPDKSIIRNRTERFFDAVADHLDIISLDPYPDVYDPNSATTIPQDIEHFHKRYEGKDIAIAEIGISALDIPDAQKRANILNTWISAIKSGNVKLLYALIYEMRHENANPDPREAKFGNEDTFSNITSQMQPSPPDSDQ